MLERTISDEKAMEFWCKVYLAQITTTEPLYNADSDGEIMTPCEAADNAVDFFAARFGTEELRAEIEEFKQEQKTGNTP